MGKRTKILATVMATTMLFAGTLVGCGGSGSSSNGEKELTVWSHLTQPEVDEVNKVAQKWGKENGVKVKVLTDKSDMQAFIQAANSSKGPDIMFGLAHDNLGTFQKAGVLAEVPNGIIKDDEYASHQVLDAVTIGGKRYAVPIAQETTALFYNKDKVKEVPKTMEDLVKVAKSGAGFEYDINNFYNSYGFIAADGGYVYKDNNGTLDPKDIGLATPGAIKGYTFIQDLVQKDKLMKPDITGDIAKGDFLAKKSGFYISGPWDVAAFKDGGVNFGVAPMPTLFGKNVPTFLGVQTAFVSEKSKNKDLAWKLVKYLSENTGDILLQKGNRIPVLKKYIDSKEFKENKYMSAFAEQAKNATPMPNIPAIQAMWGPAGANLQLLTSGKETPQQCAETTVKQIEQGIAQQK
ncbi:maltose ABC transporter substrate-binding protein [Clostridium sp.]|uniref:sugar ABC transporter substrate-binding protein n=1 Tax=Clostridium sp. TaxID=1506 RepID=UPI00261BB0DC|nr:maltose ABC transporter substrate-binding protein [Clostridium sp.]